MAAIVWLGTGLAIVLLLHWAERAQDRVFVARLASAVQRLETPIGLPGPYLLLATGIALVLDGPWSFGDLWIALGLGGYLVAAVLGARVASPRIARLVAIAGERGPDDPEAVIEGRRLGALMRVDLGVFAFVVLDMTVKPTAGAVGFWALAGAILAAAVGLAAHAYRAAAVPVPEAPSLAPR